MNITASDLTNINDLNSFALGLLRITEAYRKHLLSLREKGISPADDERANELSQQLAMAMEIMKEGDQKMWGELDGTR